MNKKMITITALCVVAIIVVFFFTRSRQIPSAPSVSAPTPETISIPLPTLQPASKTQPAYQIGEIADFPASVPKYAAGVGFSAEEITQTLVGRFGLRGQVLSVPTSKGVFFIMQDGAKTLTVGGDLLSASYESGLVPGGGLSPSLSLYQKAADDLVSSLGLFPSPIQLKPASPLFFAPIGTDPAPAKSMALATVIQINYQAHLDSFPLFTNLPTSPTIYIRLNQRAEILSLQAFVFPRLTKEAGVLAIVNKDEAKKRLVRHEGVLTSMISTARINEPRVVDVPQTSSIQNVTLGYYISPGQPLLFPVFVFSGSGTDPQTKETVQTTTLVSALP